MSDPVEQMRNQQDARIAAIDREIEMLKYHANIEKFKLIDEEKRENSTLTLAQQNDIYFMVPRGIVWDQRRDAVMSAAQKKIDTLEAERDALFRCHW